MRPTLSQFAERLVVLATRDQLVAALALIELDGLGASAYAVAAGCGL